MAGLLANGILFPIKEFLKMMSSSVIEGFLGFNLISGIVTGIILLIVIRALVQSIGAGAGIALFNQNRFVKVQRTDKTGQEFNVRVRNKDVRKSDKRGWNPRSPYGG